MGRRLGCNRGAVAGPNLCGTTIGLELWLPHTAGVQCGNRKRRYKVSEVKPLRTLHGRVALPGGRIREDVGRAIGTASMDFGGVQRAYNKGFPRRAKRMKLSRYQYRVLDLARLEPGRQPCNYGD